MAKTWQISGSTALENRPQVIKINAAEQPKAAKLRVAAYTRVSSDSADQLNSFAAQNRYYNELISSKPEWTLVDLYADAPVIIGLKQNPTQTGAALVLFSLFMGIFENFR